MKQKLQEKLFKRFPTMFANKDLLPTESPMYWGIETGDGWFNLIWETCSRIEPLVGESFHFEQIKEKYGGLRMYYSGAITDEGEKIIEEAEEKSQTICEECGKPGENREINGWWATECGKCYAKRLRSKAFNKT